MHRAIFANCFVNLGQTVQVPFNLVTRLLYVLSTIMLEFQHEYVISRNTHP